MGEIPREPTSAQAEEAADDLHHLLSGFKFVDDASKSVAMSLLVTAVLRVIMDVSPAHMISAPAPGSGKSHLADVAAMIAIWMRAP